jgi:hypothetical protein
MAEAKPDLRHQNPAGGKQVAKEEVKKTARLNPKPEPPIKHKETKATIEELRIKHPK